MIYIKNDRSVFPNNVKVSNQYENETRTINFDLSDVQFSGNTYLICKYQNNQDFYAPLLLDSDFSIPVETFLSAQAGTYSCVIAISTATIGQDYDFSTDNPLFVSNVFTLTVDANFLTGTSTAWQLTPAAQNYFDQLIALVEKVQSDLDSGAFVGNGIQSITKTGSQGLVDTYQITFTNGSTFDYQVTNGQNGQTPTITIQDGYWYINGVNTGQQAQGEQGEPGKDGTDGTDGVGIQSIEKTSTSGNVDTYTITYTNQTTSTFTVTNGVTPNITIGTVTTLQPTEQATASITGTVENPLLNLGIPQGQKGEGASDNIIYKDVAKQLNPNVTDSFQRAMWNLKLYGQSTQGADPSPTNPQEITSISEFDITVTGKNLLDEVLLKNANIYDKTLNGQGFWEYILYLKPNTKYTISRENTIGYQLGYYIRVGTIRNNLNSSTWFVAAHANHENKQAITITTNEDGIVALYFNNTIELIKKCLETIGYLQIELGETATPYTPYQAQPFTYTPTNPMYSTQDGSICDYVDVEKGVEVYNTLEQTFNGTESGWQYQSATGIAFLPLENTPQQQPFCETMQCYKYVENQPYQDGLTINNLGVLIIKIEGMTSLQDYKDYFSANPLKVRYGKSVVISTVPIPQEQLAMLRALYTYNGVTNFLCNAPVSFTYERSLQIVINNLENAIGQTNANILLNGGN